MKRIAFLVIAAVVYGCSPISQSALRKSIISSEKKFNDHIGFVLYDPTTQKTIFEHQSDRYFTPASNTKIFTLFASLQLVGDSIPGLFYREAPDSLIVWGTGDPGFLYKNTFDNGRIFSFLKNNTRPLYLSTSNFYTDAFGSGWAWDDYNSEYSPERSAFPVYGNITSFQVEAGKLNVSPKFFKHYIKEEIVEGKPSVTRQFSSNDLTYSHSRSFQRLKEDVPFKVDSLLIGELLADTLRRPVHVIHKKIMADRKVMFSVPADSLYRVMMQASDNFIAEQLLLVCSSKLTDSLKTEIAIKHVKKNFLKDLPDEPVWVDGSGLSRYNLFTPRSVVALWNKIYTQVPRERLFKILAIGGKPGTLKNYYNIGAPYVFGKTGSLSNNHCLSGFIVTKKGKTLIFSFMNSNFVKPGSDVRNNMQRILNLIHDNY